MEDEEADAGQPQHQPAVDGDGAAHQSKPEVLDHKQLSGNGGGGIGGGVGQLPQNTPGKRKRNFQPET